MAKVHLASQLTLPLDAVTQTFAFLARKGAGKTYGAMKLAEEFLDAGAQIVALDPVGVWYGLRLGANGRSKGFDIPVFGGEHGDIPLEPTSGALVAHAIVEHETSVVLDVSHFRKNQRKQFCTDFAEELFHLKKTHRSSLHFFVEEAQTFVPQKTFHGEERMLGAFEDIIKIGRNYGIGATLISQRPQAVNKDALNQTECLVVLQTNGAQERKALKEWMQAQDVDLTEMLDELPGLDTGEAYVWSPSWLKVFKRVKISARRTFNASATPEVGRRAVERKLAAIDLKQLEVAMKETVERAKAEDPKLLRQRIVELERQLARSGASPKPVKPVKEQPAVDAKDLKQAERLVDKLIKTWPTVKATIDKLDRVRDALAQSQQAVVSTIGNISTQLGRAKAPVHSQFSRSAEHLRVERAAPRIEKKAPPLSGEAPKKFEQHLLDTLAWFGVVGVTMPRRAALAGKAGHSQSGYFNNTLGAMRTAGWVEYPRGGCVTLTVEGAALANLPDASPTLAAFHKSVLDSLDKFQAQLLTVLIERYPNPMSRAELAEAVNKQESGYFNNTLGSLRTMELIDYPNKGQVVASEVMFPSGLS